MTKRNKDAKKTGTASKYVRPAGYFKQYEEKRRKDGKRRRLGIRKFREILSSVLDAKQSRDMPYAMCLLDMEYRGNSYRVHAGYMDSHPGSVTAYGLKRVPSKSCLHAAAVRIASWDGDVLASVLSGQAGKDSRGTLLGDSTGFSIMRYEDWEDAKKGTVSRRMSARLHVLVRPHGRIAACRVTPGRRHDSPVFGDDLLPQVPEADGGRRYVILDAAYDSYANCAATGDGGRIPVILPRGGYAVRGFNARARMLKWFREDRDGSGKTYHRRSLVEAVFSSIKERFGGTVRAMSLPMQSLRLTPRVFCYNLVN